MAQTGGHSWEGFKDEQLRAYLSRLTPQQRRLVGRAFAGVGQRGWTPDRALSQIRRESNAAFYLQNFLVAAVGGLKDARRIAPGFSVDGRPHGPITERLLEHVRNSGVINNLQERLHQHAGYAGDVDSIPGINTLGALQIALADDATFRNVFEIDRGTSAPSTAAVAPPSVRAVAPPSTPGAATPLFSNDEARARAMQLEEEANAEQYERAQARAGAARLAALRGEAAGQNPIGPEATLAGERARGQPQAHRPGQGPAATASVLPAPRAPAPPAHRPTSDIGRWTWQGAADGFEPVGEAAAARRQQERLAEAGRRRDAAAEAQRREADAALIRSTEGDWRRLERELQRQGAAEAAARVRAQEEAAARRAAEAAPPAPRVVRRRVPGEEVPVRTVRLVEPAVPGIPPPPASQRPFDALGEAADVEDSILAAAQRRRRAELMRQGIDATAAPTVSLLHARSITLSSRPTIDPTLPSERGPLTSPPAAPPEPGSSVPPLPGIIDYTRQAAEHGISRYRMRGPAHGLVVHYTTAGRNRRTGALQYSGIGPGSGEGLLSTFEEEGTAVQYFISRDIDPVTGRPKVYRLLPEGYTGAHIRPGEGIHRGRTSANHIGVEISARDEADVLPEQILELGRIAAREAVVNKFDPQTNVVSHAEVNPRSRRSDEGIRSVYSIRGNPLFTLENLRNPEVLQRIYENRDIPPPVSLQQAQETIAAEREAARLAAQQEQERQRAKRAAERQARLEAQKLAKEQRAREREAARLEERRRAEQRARDRAERRQKPPGGQAEQPGDRRRDRTGMVGPSVAPGAPLHPTRATSADYGRDLTGVGRRISGVAMLPLPSSPTVLTANIMPAPVPTPHAEEEPMSVTAGPSAPALAT